MPSVVNKTAIAAAFGRAARSYNQHAQLQRRCGNRLMALSRAGKALSVLDAGCGSGWFSRQWREAGHQVTALDLSAEMLQQAAQAEMADRYQQGDIEALPFASACFDRSWSNLAVQWCSDLQRALSELLRVTRPGGQVLFSTVAAGSLQEVEQAWQHLGMPAPVNRFATEQAIRDAIPAQGRLHLHPLTLSERFPDVLSALRSLKGIGATHLHQGRQAQPLTRSRLQQLEQGWPRDGQDCLLTYQLMLGVIDCE